MKVISENRKGLYGYKIIEKHEAGISLLGWEVKSARAQTVNLTNSYIFFKKGELFLCNANFAKYMLLKVEEDRDRKLLMHKKEIIRLKNKLDRLSSTTIKPTKIYFNNKSKIKVEIALVQGMNRADKREDLKKRDNEKYMQKVKSNYL
ncbi:SsrA-binding protein [Mycoplasmopsis agalactiae]|uniref:SsrA-binding protein n=1 Tax=Mycoplasmopsis agalactiae (strain NCTC 10123 / CIP 59.7 / PG2) TaxID=347257 RepID=SSRP_MYCAP|nr:SsrA-binding protein [Mycoplasmopsis agalactiae]A5IZI0.1 RecName: Full=SsrA-binding protein; AltName: Full=Small protein B [Mycoplasmopsis agalactiae PG2]MCE6057459.1 SsrA-binding protein [Mycoplasmopsis agalactiae]MCE6079235.1 SsrA-binding protein [Mycoplasmopsis agalactiae]MCE6095628.1 SsrA-binding protein [Mycoplasmopsis agalactiae]MCE6114874.1 SsrA-binding protein [Mycoplasmopsis agalactiae]NLS34608.1 SsrA-binding protein [Mycoplasmopsis agalactiae]